MNIHLTAIRRFAKIIFSVPMPRAALLAILLLLPVAAAQAAESEQSCYLLGETCYIVGNTCFYEGANCGDGSSQESLNKWKTGWCQAALQVGVISGTLDQCMDGSARTLYEHVLVSSLDPSVPVVLTSSLVASAQPSNTQQSQSQGSSQQRQSQSGNQQSNSGNSDRQSSSQGNNQQQNQQDQQDEQFLILPQEENQQQTQYQQQQQQQQQHGSYQDRRNALQCGDTMDVTGLGVMRCGDNDQGEYVCEEITEVVGNCGC